MLGVPNTPARSFCRSRACSGGDNGKRAVFLARGPDGDFDVLEQGGEKLHEAANGKVARAVAHQQGDLRLLHAENFGDLHLGHAAVLEDRVDLQGELRFEQLLLGIGKSQVGKDVSAAFGYPGSALAGSSCLGFHFSSLTGFRAPFF